LLMGFWPSSQQKQKEAHGIAGRDELGPYLNKSETKS
jgi:hypothetical protein